MRGCGSRVVRFPPRKEEAKHVFSWTRRAGELGG